MIKNYSHFVYVVERDGQTVIRIDRLIDDRRDFYTEIEVEKHLQGEIWASFDKLSELIGKSLCIDSPKLRSLLKIDDAPDRRE